MCTQLNVIPHSLLILDDDFQLLAQSLLDDCMGLGHHFNPAVAFKHKVTFDIIMLLCTVCVWACEWVDIYIPTENIYVYMLHNNYYLLGLCA